MESLRLGGPIRLPCKRESIFLVFRHHTKTYFAFVVVVVVIIVVSVLSQLGTKQTNTITHKKINTQG